MNCTSAPGERVPPGRSVFFHRISHPSTGPAPPLVKLAKTAKIPFKKLSQFRLAFYKLYGEVSTGRSLTVENSVERVEFHLKSGREACTFSLSPQGFQRVENKDPLYNWYTAPYVENSLPHNRRPPEPYYPRGQTPSVKTALFYGKEGRGMVYFNLDYSTKNTPVQGRRYHDD